MWRKKGREGWMERKRDITKRAVDLDRIKKEKTMKRDINRREDKTE